MNLSRFLLISILFFYSSISFGQSDFPKINLYYIVPSDQSVNQAYIDGIEKAISHLQSFYAEQTGGHVFSLNQEIVQVFQSSNNSAWHGDQMWGRAIETVGARFFEENDIHIIYVDAVLACTEGNAIGGNGGIAVLATNDLRGLAGLTTVPDCNGDVDERDVFGWIGGLGHELGHALRLPHPHGCDDGHEECDQNSLMWLGYRQYPDTYFGADAISVLQNSNFLSENYLNPHTLPMVEGFEGGVSWVDVGEFDWMVNSGTTISHLTGPNAAAEGSQYLYFETSDYHANNSGDEAILESGVFTSEDAKFTFKYHMYGSETGQLSVDVATNGIWSTVWSVSGQQHTSHSDEWTDQLIRLDDFSGNIKIRIRATAVGGHLGDIAVDQLKIHTDIEILSSRFDGNWFRVDWTPVSYANSYTQFVIGDSDSGSKTLFRNNEGAYFQDFVYQHYHRTDICDAFGEGTYQLGIQIWPGTDSSRAVTKAGIDTISCP